MVGKDKPTFHASHHVTAIAFLLIGIIITTSISFVFPLVLNQNHTAMAQQQQLQANQTFSPSVEEQQQLLEGISFQIDNVTFSHHMASVNGIQMHYVMGGQGDPVVLLHGWPQSWYEWRHIMPALAENYTVIAPDLRGFGDSSKPTTGYDGNTTAEDVYQLVSQLGFSEIFLVGHDVGVQTAYSYTAAHPNNVTRLVFMDYVFPGFIPPEIGQGPWWFSFHQVPNLPEALVEGKEREYLSWFFKGLAYNPSAITEEDLDVYASQNSAPGAMRAGFEYYRAFPVDAEQNIESAMNMITTPVLVLGADFYAALGDPGNIALSTTQPLAADVRGVIVPLSGHWIPEEQPEFVIDQLSSFFGDSTNGTGDTGDTGGIFDLP